MKEHDETKHTAAMRGLPGRRFRYAGAIGGAYTWCYTSTSIGTVIRVECSCGESLDVSDYDLW